jgi:hypothetical protein
MAGQALRPRRQRIPVRPLTVGGRHPHRRRAHPGHLPGRHIRKSTGSSIIQELTAQIQPGKKESSHRSADYGLYCYSAIFHFLA